MANYNFQFTNLSDGLPELCAAVLDRSAEVGRTKELIATSITLHRPEQRELVLPGRNANIAAQIAETMWVLTGKTSGIVWLSHYLPRAVDFADDGKHWRAAYGPRLRNWKGVDQVAYVVNALRDNPQTRQAVIALWDPEVDILPGLDRACNTTLQFTSRLGALDMHVSLRSNDVMWGLSGINAFCWSSLQEIIAELLGIGIGAMHLAAGSLHIYDQHWAKARRISEQRTVGSYLHSPAFSDVKSLSQFDGLAAKWFYYEELIRTGATVDVDAFPEPMLRSWLRVLQWYWNNGDVAYLAPLQGTRLYAACLAGVGPATPASAPDFLAYVNALHAEKHAAYGDSWKRRGEPGILANIARKVDRIDSGLDTSDETQADTAVDLMVYLAKYLCWLEGDKGDPDDVAALLRQVEQEAPHMLDKSLFVDFDALWACTDRDEKRVIARRMLLQSFNLALSLWSK